MKDLMNIFERKWKQFYDNRQEYLGEDTSKVINCLCFHKLNYF